MASRSPSANVLRRFSRRSQQSLSRGAFAWRMNRLSSALVVAGMAGLGLVPLAQASAQTAPAAKAYAIAAGPLAPALTEFANRAGVTLQLNPALIGAAQTAGLHATVTIEQGFATLVRGTGLEVDPVGAQVYQLRAAPTAAGSPTILATVTVRGSSPAPTPSLHLNTAVASGALGTRSQLDTPFSTAVVTADQLAARQVNSAADAFATDPSVSNQNVVYTIWGTELLVRGLDLDTANGYKINGMPVYAQGLDIPYEQLDSVTLLKGLSGFMYGFGSPGGIADFETKKPAPDAVRSVDVGYRSNSLWSEHADIGNAFGPDDRFGYRINATHEEGHTYNGGTDNRNAVTVGLAAHLTPDLTWTGNVVHQERRATGEISAFDTSSYTGSNLPSAISGKSRLASDGTYDKSSLTVADTGLEYKITPDWTASMRFAYEDVVTSFVKDYDYLDNPSGAFDDYLLADKDEFTNKTWRAMVQGHVVTGPLDHQLVFGLEKQVMDMDSDTNGFFDYLGEGSLYSSNNLSYTGGGIDWQMYRSGEYDQNAAFASDTVSFLKHWSAIAGIRYTNYEQRDWDDTGAQTSRYARRGVPTPTLALMYKPNDHVTFYGSYVEALEQGTIVGSEYANANQMLKPMISKQYELGVKAQEDRLSGTAALFRIERAAAYANSDNVYVQSGQTIYQGLELNSNYHLGSNTVIGAGSMLLNAEYERGAAFDGNRVIGAPHIVSTAYVSYNVPQVPGLSLQSNVKFVGKTYADDANSLQVGTHTLFGLGASYQTRIAEHTVTYRAQIDNLFNRQGWVSEAANTEVIPVQPRTFMFNAAVSF